MAADRRAYGASQAELLTALMSGGEPPEGFGAAQADAAGRSLRRKRSRAVRRAWPALALALGERFDERFDAFARAHEASDRTDGLADGLAFASSPCAAEALDDDVRVEILLARAALVRRRAPAGIGWRSRRGVFVAALRLARPYPRLLVVVRLPGLGVRWVSMPAAAGRSALAAAPRINRNQ